VNGGRPALPALVDRRFEAVLVWSSRPDLGPDTARALSSLHRAGAAVGVLAPISPTVLSDRLADEIEHPPLLMADSSGNGGMVLGSSALRPARSPDHGASLRALEAAGASLAERLAAFGLDVPVYRHPDGRPRVTLDVMPGLGLGTVSPAAARAARAEVRRLLGARGIGGVGDLATLAAQVARDAGIEDPRVLVDGGTVEIALVDAGDVAVAMVEELWHRGVDPQAVLLVIDGLAGFPRRPVPLVDLDLGAVTSVLVNGAGAAAPPGVLALAGGRARMRQLLVDQRRRRERRTLPAPVFRDGWSLIVEGDGREERVHGAILTLADGRIGMSGSLVAVDPARPPFMVAEGVYDGQGTRTHLLTGPVAFGLGGLDGADHETARRVLDLRTGVLHERFGRPGTVVESVRFVSIARPATAVLRVRHPGALPAGPALLPPADDPVHDRGRRRQVSWMRVAGSTGGIAAAATERRTRRQGAAGGDEHVVDRVALYHPDPEELPDAEAVVEALGPVAALGFERLLAEHREAWARRWHAADVVVEGDHELQLGVRYALFHLMASVADTGEAAVGARGLTGTGYSGHVFWDADTFVLPFLAATHPAAARAMLEYRIRRLPAAMIAARAAARAGARYPWESARTGEDVTPISARDRAGKLVPIRTGQLEEHIVAEVPWAAACYVDWTGDEEFARGPGRHLLVETARYWASRIRVEPDGSAHIYGVVGPDEYHEPVDDNAFTNVMARWNLRRAAEAVALGEDVGEAECRRWLALAEALVDGYDGDSGVYEQFAGFHRLEPLLIAEVAPRRPIAADLLLGAERTRGAQVVKQADVLMLHHLVPDEVVPGSLEPNLRFYEPRTAHGSSLSPAIHASVLARAQELDAALASLRLAVRMDLDDLTGSTATGLHLATMGGVWQALAHGFMGLRPQGDVLRVDPVLPSSWSSLEIRVRFRDVALVLRKEHTLLTVSADGRVSLDVGGLALEMGPQTCTLRRRGPKWEVVT